MISSERILRLVLSDKSPNLPERIGEGLQILRTIKGFTQKTLGDLIGKSAQFISKIEAGKFKDIKRICTGTLKEILDRLEVPIEEFFSEYVEGFNRLNE